MYGLIDLPELTRMADLAEDVDDESFDMSCFIRKTSCGTAGCLIGTWAIQSRNDRLQLLDSGHFTLDDRNIGNDHAISRRFLFCREVAGFLFWAHGNRTNTNEVPDARDMDKRSAVARLRKYIVHVEDQRRKWANHEWLMQRPKAERRAILLAPRQKQEAVAV